jgi:hypothetical protein
MTYSQWHKWADELKKGDPCTFVDLGKESPAVFLHTFKTEACETYWVLRIRDETPVVASWINLGTPEGVTGVGCYHVR